ncbi:MAG: EamA family transporter [Candidatus Yanofskybacteria bacterium]|nr:EamA family transporter [Candidatus Yanofskybacteria bacterium]
MLLKKGSLTLGEIAKSPRGVIDLGLSMLRNLNVLGSLAMFGLAFFMWTWVLSKMQLNVVYPIAVAVQLILLSIGSWFLLKESLSFIQIIGVSIIILGIFLLLKTN